jgi:ABC-type proline/glycine betaine transport system ATPase subunit
MTVIYVSHDIHEASQLASRALILEKGRISQLASITEIKARPATPFIERLTTSKALS